MILCGWMQTNQPTNHAAQFLTSPDIYHTASPPSSEGAATCHYPESSQSSPNPPTYYLKIHFNNVLWPTPRSSQWFLSFLFSHQTSLCIYFLPHMCPCPAHLIPLHLIRRLELGIRTENNTTLNKQVECTHTHTHTTTPVSCTDDKGLTVNKNRATGS
jgi:hypothetical protein